MTQNNNNEKHEPQGNPSWMTWSSNVYIPNIERSESVAARSKKKKTSRTFVLMISGILLLAGGITALTIYLIHKNTPEKPVSMLAMQPTEEAVVTTMQIVTALQTTVTVSTTAQTTATTTVLSTTTESTTLTTTEITTEPQTTEPEVTTEETQTETTTVTVPHSAWKPIYVQKIRQMAELYGTESTGYSLYDMNVDGIPELFIADGNDDAARVKIYSILHEKFVEVGTVGSNGRILISDDGQRLYETTMYMGYWWGIQYEWREDAVEMVMSLSENTALEQPSYSYNDMVVSQEEFDRMKAEYLQKCENCVELGHHYLLSEEINADDIIY